MIDRKEMMGENFKRERNYSEETRTSSIYEPHQMNQGLSQYLNEPTKKVQLNENINYTPLDQKAEKK